MPFVQGGFQGEGAGNNMHSRTLSLSHYIPLIRSMFVLQVRALLADRTRTNPKQHVILCRDWRGVFHVKVRNTRFSLR